VKRSCRPGCAFDASRSSFVTAGISAHMFIPVRHNWSLPHTAHHRLTTPVTRLATKEDRRLLGGAHG
jgi:hypothetical protein